MPWCIGLPLWRASDRVLVGWIDVSLTDVNLAEIIVRTVKATQILCRSVVDGADSQA